MATVAENDYQTKLERTKLEESLQEESAAEATAGRISAVSSKTGNAGASFSVAAKAVASGQYAVWQAIWDFFAPTFGLSLLLIYVPIFSWLAKKTFPDAIAKKLPEPGEDGMLGFVPPPTPQMSKLVTPLYGLVNKITMGVLFMIVTPILLLLLLIAIAPIALALRGISQMLGPIGQILSNLFGGL